MTTVQKRIVAGGAHRHHVTYEEHKVVVLPTVDWKEIQVRQQVDDV